MPSARHDNPSRIRSTRELIAELAPRSPIVPASLILAAAMVVSAWLLVDRSRQGLIVRGNDKEILVFDPSSESAYRCNAISRINVECGERFFVGISRRAKIEPEVEGLD